MGKFFGFAAMGVGAVALFFVLALFALAVSFGIGWVIGWLAVWMIPGLGVWATTTLGVSFPTAFGVAFVLMRMLLAGVRGSD